MRVDEAASQMARSTNYYCFLLLPFWGGGGGRDNKVDNRCLLEAGGKGTQAYGLPVGKAGCDKFVRHKVLLEEPAALIDPQWQIMGNHT